MADEVLTTLKDSVVFARHIATSAEILRTAMEQRVLSSHNIPLTDARVWDSLQVLPTSASADDLALLARTFGTNAARIETGDCKNTTTTRYCRMLMPLPNDYQDGETVTVRVAGGMDTTVASSSCTVDVEAYRWNGTGGIGSDICATAAQSINNLTAANKDFTITPTTLIKGDMLDVRLTIVVTDVATGTAVIGVICAVWLLADLR